MARGSDIAAALPADHTVARDSALFQAIASGHIVPIEWHPVPISHRFHDGSTIRGTVFVARHALQIGEPGDAFRPTVSHPTAQRVADALASVAAAKAPDGVVLPTAKIMDAAFQASTVKVDPCLQEPGPTMRSTARMLEHSRAVDAAIGGREGLTSSEGKAWANTARLRGHPELSANYGLYDDGALYRGVLGAKLWQPGPGLRHISGINSTVNPEGYTDYIQVLERLVKATMHVEGRGEMLIHDVAKDPKLAWLVSTEGPLVLRHPGVLDADETKQTTETPAPARALLTRTIRRGMMGEDVRFVQAIVGAEADGVFGAKTEAKVKAFQSSNTDQAGRALTVDGVVGPATRRALIAKLVMSPTEPEVPAAFNPNEYDPARAEYREARYFNREVIRDVVHWIVLHAAEAAELPSTAEALMRYAVNMADGRMASWHWAFDEDSATRSVPEDRIAYHAKSANRFGVGYEHAGYTRQSKQEWLDDYSASMLWISATTAARITIPRWGLPADNFVDAEGLKKAQRLIAEGKEVPNELRGFTTHVEVTRGLGGTHTDPGKGFPTDRYMQMVKEAA